MSNHARAETNVVLTIAVKRQLLWRKAGKFKDVVTILWVGVQAATTRRTGAQALDLAGEQVTLGFNEEIGESAVAGAVMSLIPRGPTEAHLAFKGRAGDFCWRYSWDARVASVRISGSNVLGVNVLIPILRQLLKKVNFDAAHDTLVHAGDIIVKGPNSRKVLQDLILLNALGVRGNQDQKVVEWRGWIQWVLRHKQGRAWLTKMEKRVHAIKKKPTKADYKYFRKEAATKGWKIPPGWEFGSDVYQLGRHLKPNEYQYLLDLPTALHIPSLHTIVVHAGILPMDPRRKMLSRHQPLSHPPKSKHNETEPVLRTIQERALLSDIPQNADPWAKLNMRSILENGEVSREKDGTPWTDLWNKVFGLCDGFDVKPELDRGEATFEASPGQSWAKWVEDELKGIRSLPCKDVTVVYGHAASRGLDIKKWSKGLDTGCVYNIKLTALVLGKRWKPGFAVNATGTEDLDYLMEVDDELEGQLVTYGRKGHAKVVQVRCAGGSSRLH
ncbi:hypothetical protein FRC06_001984 [Ceratobasidium sp. 370]|nr:hypothetical protein FRC06_001984 [Ceratobasidium sp. 370]